MKEGTLTIAEQKQENFTLGKMRVREQSWPLPSVGSEWPRRLSWIHPMPSALAALGSWARVSCISLEPRSSPLESGNSTDSSAHS